LNDKPNINDVNGVVICILFVFIF